MGLDSVSVWDAKAALHGCWMECESNPKMAFSYPGNSDLFLSGYRDDATRDNWYDNVLFFSCLDGCRSRHQAQRLTIIILPTIAAIIIIFTLLFCCICKSCPIARCCKGDRYDSAYRRKIVPSPSPIMVNTVSGYNSQQGYNDPQGYPLPPGYTQGTQGYPQPPPGYNQPPPVASGYSGMYDNSCNRRRTSILQRKLHNLDSTLGICAPEAAHYDPEAVARTAARVAQHQGGTRPGTRMGWAEPVPEEGRISRIAASAKRRVSITRNKKKSSGKIKIAET